MKDFSFFCGANFVPSTAINQLEMWQAEFFDLAAIDRELGWAAGLGMNCMRVYLHDLLWEDAEGFRGRIDRYLGIAAGHGIKTLFVFFDDCWRDEFALGKQPEPVPCAHNSGWIKSPGTRVANNPAAWGRLETYVKGVLEAFGRDERILGWDLYNEPGNGNAGDHKTLSGLRGSLSLPLLQAVFRWAREAKPSQPITAGIWKTTRDFDELNHFMAENSDIFSFHSYFPPDILREQIGLFRLLAAGRPMICTEYMARGNGSTFRDCLPLLRQEGVSAINWGLVSGKTQTVFPWGWSKEKGEPPVWFHDVFHTDGTLLYPEERSFFL